MGANKMDFMQDRESESFASQLLHEDALQQESDLRAGFTALSNRFEYDVDQYENGNISALDLAVKFKNEMDIMSTQIENRKAWLDENKSTIAGESEGHGKSGYKGLIFTVQIRSTPSYKNIDSWVKADELKKKIEAKAKLAMQLMEKGIDPVDAQTGELLPVPEVKISSFLKTDKAK